MQIKTFCESTDVTTCDLKALTVLIYSNLLLMILQHGVSVGQVCLSKTAILIEVLFGVEILVDPRCIVLDGKSQSPYCEKRVTSVEELFCRLIGFVHTIQDGCYVGW